MDFKTAFKIVIGHEGGFTQNPDDRGNWTSGKVGVGVNKGTKFGVSAMAYPNLDIKNLTVQQAEAIYYTDYWLPAGCEKVGDAVKFDLFDTAVNSGIGTAVKLLQRAAGVTDDGVLGPKTLQQVLGMDQQLLDKRFSGQRLLYICDLKTWPNFGKGWVRRVANNLIGD